MNRSAACLVLSGAVVLTAATRQVFHVGTDTVLLSVTVVDGHDHPVTDLDENSFTILEDGIRQNVEFFAQDPQPIALSMLIDSSSSMEGTLPVAQTAAIGFCQRLGPNDLAQIIDFNNQTDIRQTFTHDLPSLERAIRSIHAGGSTSLYTAIYVALKELARAASDSPTPLRREGIIVLSDGEDTTSLLPYDDVIEQAKRSSVAVYAIGLREHGVLVHNGAGRFNESDYFLRTLAQTTGGRAFFVDSVTMLPEIYQDIASELGNQYVIGYESSNPKRDGAWRQIVARVSRPETIVRTRTGYFGPK